MAMHCIPNHGSSSSLPFRKDHSHYVAMEHDGIAFALLLHDHDRQCAIG